MAAQFQAAGTTLANILGITQTASVILGAMVILIYTFIGGFWAVSLDRLYSSSIDVLYCYISSITFLHDCRWFFWSKYCIGGNRHLEEKSLTGVYTGMLGIGFIIGNISIGFGYPGQPFVVNRFMAAKDINTIKRGKYIAMFWALIIFSGMILAWA